MSDRSQKADLVVVQWWFVSLLLKLSIGSENCALSLCAYVEGFCHICYTTVAFLDMFIIQCPVVICTMLYETVVLLFRS